MKRLGMFLVVAGAIAFVYREAPGAYFFEDDFQWLVSRWSFHPAHLLDLRLFDHFYRPVIEMYFWLGLALFGGSPGLFHAANLGLHAANVLVLFLLARKISGSERYAFLSALFFAVLPGYVEAIAWVSALAEPIAAFFGCLAIASWLTHRSTGATSARVWSVLLLLLALLTHESSVVFVPLLGLADLAFADAGARVRSREGLAGLLRDYLPFLLVTAAYLAADLWINSRSYLLAEGHYRFGPHAARNMLDYLASLYVGRRNPASFMGTTLVVTALLVLGTPRVRFATAWMLLALLPFVFFTWTNTSRYQYLPAMGFSLLLAEGVEWLDPALSRRLRREWRMAVVVLLVAAVTVRFMLFASKAVGDFAERTEVYREVGQTIRSQYREGSGCGEVRVDPAVVSRLGPAYVVALARWECRDPAVRIVADAGEVP